MKKTHDVKNINNLVIKGIITPAEAFTVFTKIECNKIQENNKGQDEEKLEDIMREFEDLIGLTNIKHLVKEIQAFVIIQNKRRQENLQSDPLVLHMIFKGNPGTGKTTVARLLGKMFKHMNLLQKGHIIEVERADLVGEYIGHTAQKTREQIRRALGGILFIDEAYSLARGGEKDFGKEAIDTLVKATEDNKDNLIVILAGYKDEMERFLNTNPGLRSRFPIIMDFNDYTINELMDIAGKMAKKRDYKLNYDAKDKLRKLLLKSKQDDISKMGNARMVRNILEKSIRRQALRLVNKDKITRDDLLYITGEDIVEVREY